MMETRSKNIKFKLTHHMLRTDRPIQHCLQLDFQLIFPIFPKHYDGLPQQILYDVHNGCNGL